MCFTDRPPARAKPPPTYTLVPAAAIAITGPPTRALFNANHSWPSHRAMLSTVRPPAVAKYPAATMLSLTVSSAFTPRFGPEIPPMPAESGDHVWPSHLATFPTATEPAAVNRPPAYRLVPTPVSESTLPP